MIAARSNIAPAPNHVIDCDADPFVPNGWEVVSHRKAGSFIWEPSRIQLYLSETQRRGEYIRGIKLFSELQRLKSVSILNANVLWYLLRHKELIPGDWRNKNVTFWGTSYRRPNGVYVCYLRDSHNGWQWEDNLFEGSWSPYSPAALLPS